MATLSDIADEVLLAFEGYGLDMPRGAHLVGDLSGSGLSFPVTSAAFVQEGLAEIGDELIDIVSVSDSGSGSPIVTVAPDGRGFRGTPVSFHPAGSRVTCSPPIPRDLIRRKVNETITGLWPTLWAQGDHEFTMTGSASLYPLPGDAEEVVSVRFEDRGPGDLWPTVRSWRMAQPSTAESGTSSEARTRALASA